jgi:hypothetical protein
MNLLETKLAILYALAFVPILYFVIRSKRSPLVFVLGAATVFASSFVVRAGVESIAGYPTADAVPEHMELVGFHSTPPGADAERPEGSIYLFGTAASDAAKGSWLRYVPADDEPRAYALPYSEDLHEALQAMDAARQQDRLVEFEIVNTAQAEPGQTPGPSSPEARSDAQAPQTGGQGLRNLLDEARGLAIGAKQSTDRGAAQRKDPDELADALSTMSAQLSGAARALRLESQDDLAWISENLATLGRESGAYDAQVREHLRSTIAEARATAQRTQQLLEGFRGDLQTQEYATSGSQLAQLNEVGKAGFRAVQTANKSLAIGATRYRKDAAREAAVSASQFATAAGMTDDESLKATLGGIAESLQRLSASLGHAAEPADLVRHRAQIGERSDRLVERIDRLDERMSHEAEAAQAQRNEEQEKILPLAEGRMIRLSALPRQQLTKFAK